MGNITHIFSFLKQGKKTFYFSKLLKLVGSHCGGFTKKWKPCSIQCCSL